MDSLRDPSRGIWAGMLSALIASTGSACTGTQSSVQQVHMISNRMEH